MMGPGDPGYPISHLRYMRPRRPKRISWSLSISHRKNKRIVTTTLTLDRERKLLGNGPDWEITDNFSFPE